jgi:hypothetical protein
MLLEQDTPLVQELKLESSYIRKRAAEKPLKSMQRKPLYIDTHQEVRRQISVHKNTSTFFYPFYHYERLHL